MENAQQGAKKARKHRRKAPEKPAPVLVPTGTPNKQVVVLKPQTGKSKKQGTECTDGAMVVRDTAQPPQRVVSLAKNLDEKELLELFLHNSQGMNGFVGIAIQQHVQEQQGVLAQVNKLRNEVCEVFFV